MINQVDEVSRWRLGCRAGTATDCVFEMRQLDHNMLGMGMASQTLRGIRRRKTDAPVVMATADGLIELAVDAKRAGEMDFLKKLL